VTSIPATNRNKLVNRYNQAKEELSRHFTKLLDTGSLAQYYCASDEPDSLTPKEKEREEPQAGRHAATHIFNFTGN